MYKLSIVALCLIVTSASGQSPTPSSAPSVSTNTQVSRRAVASSRMRARVEYQNAVADFKRTFAAAEEARQRLSRLEPAGAPDIVDCYFHPWHAGCQQLWSAVEQSRGPEWTSAVKRRVGPIVSDEQLPPEQGRILEAILAWTVGKAMDYAWAVGKCLVKADGPDGRGLEGTDGPGKVADCFR